MSRTKLNAKSTRRSNRKPRKKIHFKAEPKISDKEAEELIKRQESREPRKAQQQLKELRKRQESREPRKAQQQLVDTENGLLDSGSNMPDAHLNQDSFDTNYDTDFDLNDIDMRDWEFGTDEEIERELEEIKRHSKKIRKDVSSAPTAKGEDAHDFDPEDPKHTPPGMHKGPLMEVTTYLRAVNVSPPANPDSTLMCQSN